MPLISKIGGGGSKRAVTGAVTFVSASKLRIDLEGNSQNFKYLVLYMTGGVTVSGNTGVVLSVINSINNDVPLMKDTLSKKSTVFSAASYGDVSVYDGTSVFSITRNTDNIEITITSGSTQSYKFKQEVLYVYELFY